MTAPPSTSRHPAAHDVGAGDREPAESPASVRRTFVVLTALGGLLLLAPRQWVSAAILLVLSAVLAARHVVVSRREAAGRPATPAPAGASTPEATATPVEAAAPELAGAAAPDPRSELPPSA